VRALIVGAGNAGLVAAIALHKAGVEPAVYEAYGDCADHAREGYLTVAVNGIDALRAVDAGHLLLGPGFACADIEFMSGTGKVLGTVPMGAELADGTVAHLVRRADLQRGLRKEARRRGIGPVNYGKRLVGADKLAGGGVVAHFEDGSCAEGDVLIGADGVHSVTRTIVDAGNPGPRYLGVGNTGGIAEGVDVGVRPGKYRAVWGRACTYGYAVEPQGRVWWFAYPPRRTELPRAFQRTMTSEQLRQALVELLGADDTVGAQIVHATTTRLCLSNQYALPTLPTWHNGAMVIIGDAAHALVPASGQGCSIAIEDAVVLAQCLRDVPTVAAALARYEELRRPRVDRIVRWTRKPSSYRRRGTLARMTRDLVLPYLLARAAGRRRLESMSWLFGHHIEWSQPVSSSGVPVPAPTAGPTKPTARSADRVPR
jgi:2-polyprenyl-6-methoxyphenol hydroxylase-like FAD-dependent oxidoreductase